MTQSNGDYNFDSKLEVGKYMKHIGVKYRKIKRREEVRVSTMYAQAYVL